MKLDIAIIGGGLSGLTAAHILNEHNVDFCLFESQKKVGGRVQSETVNGYICDHGFQVLLPAYPTAKKYLDYSDLDLHYYPSGANIRTLGEHALEWFGAPFLFPNKFKIGNKLDISLTDYIKLGFEVLNGSYPDPIELSNSTLTSTYLKGRYSKALVEKFLMPFFKGVFLEKKCNVSKLLFSYYLNCFAKGGAAIPKEGIEAIPRQLINSISEDRIKCDSKVSKVEEKCIVFDDGRKVYANQIIFACDQKGISELVDDILPPEKPRSVYTTFFSTTILDSLGPLNFILNTDTNSQISIPTLINNHYSENNDHLCMVTTIGQDENSDMASHAKDPGLVKKELKESLGSQVDEWTFQFSHSIKYALPSIKAVKNQLSDSYYFCGDWMSFGSIESAMRSGESVAFSVLNKLKS